MSSEARDFYFFDFDKNIMRVTVPFVVINSKTGEEKEMSSGQYMSIRDQLGKEDPWIDWNDDDAMRYYSDLADVSPQEQPFSKQIEEAIDSGDPQSWQAPAWPVFVYACATQVPFSLITARGHSDATIKAGFEVLKDRGYIDNTPNYLTLYNVTNPETEAELGGTAGEQDVQALKKEAILKSVDEGISKYGSAPHHFGMSDDTMANVEFIADAMRVCKERYPKMRFFVISTNLQHMLKAEIFPMNLPVEGHGDPNGDVPLRSHLY